MYVSGVVRGVEQQISVVDSTGMLPKAYLFDTEADAFKARDELDTVVEHSYYIDTVQVGSEEDRVMVPWSKGTKPVNSNRLSYGRVIEQTDFD
jgi:hypothetical protein